MLDIVRSFLHNPFARIISFHKTPWILLLLLSFAVLTGCGSGGGASGNATVSDLNPFPPGEPLSRNIQITGTQASPDGRQVFSVSLTDPAGKPLFVSRKELSGYSQGQPVSLNPSPPASSPEVETENQKAIRESRTEDVRYDHWTYVTEPPKAMGTHTFGVIVRNQGKEYKNLLSRSIGYLEFRKAQLAAEQTAPPYNGPPYGTYDSWVANLNIGPQEYNPGDTIVATVDLLSSQWASTVEVSCSYADPNSITLDGQPVPRSSVSSGVGGYYWFWYWGIPQPYPDSPSYKITVSGVGSHTVRFKLDPQYENKYFTSTPGSWSGPFVSMGTGSWQEAVGFIIRPGQRNLAIQNFKATPEEFTPSDQTTTITADIVATGFTPTNLKWDLVIKDQAGALVRNFPQGSGSTVSVIWDGRNSAGDIVPAGWYVCELIAICDEGLQAQGLTQVALIPHRPVLEKIVFPDAQSLLDDNGDPFPHPITYYQESAQTTLHHPIVITIDSLGSPVAAARAAQTQGQVTTGQAVTLTPTLYFEPGTYRIRILDPQGRVITSAPYLVQITRKGSETLSVIVDQLAKEVQKIDFIKVEHQIIGVDDRQTDRWKEVLDSKRQVVRLTEPIYVALGPYMTPLDKGKNGKGPTRGFLDIAYFLARGAKTPDEVRNSVVQRMCSWLEANQFVYNPGVHQFSISGPSENRPRSGEFNYAQFMVWFGHPTIPWEGNCEDVSAFAVLCCAAIGVDLQLTRSTGPITILKGPKIDLAPFQTNPIKPCAVKEIDPETWEYKDPAFHAWMFTMHQTTVLQVPYLVWDPTFEFESPWTHMLGVNGNQFFYNILVKPGWEINRFPIFPLGEVTRWK